MAKNFELIMINNDIHIAQLADRAGVNYIMIDLEINGKRLRQSGNSHITDHVIEDIPRIQKVLQNSKLLVRINPLNINSKMEIEQVLGYGIDYIMLPMFTTLAEVEQFIEFVDKRAKTMLLLETAEALARLDLILDINGIDAMYIGLNDLHLSMKLDFMFELLAGGILDSVIPKIVNRNIVCGFGGIAKIGEGFLPSEYIIREHAKLGSTMAILSRTFKNSLLNGNIDQETNFQQEINNIREEYRRFLNEDYEAQRMNRAMIKSIIRQKVYVPAASK